jgi:thiol:disulfide interchange protein
VPDSPDDLPPGLVFSSLQDAPARRRRTLAFVTVAIVAGLALVWPVYPSVAGIRPYVLGLPFSLVWVVGWLVVVFVALVLFYRAEEHDTNDG